MATPLAKSADNPRAVLSDDSTSLDTLATTIHEAWDVGRAAIADAWEARLTIGCALRDARAQFPGDREFGRWVSAQDFGFGRNRAWEFRRIADREVEARALLSSLRTAHSDTDVPFSTLLNELYPKQMPKQIASGMSKEEAEALQQQVTDNLEAWFWTTFGLWARQVWKVLDYASWDEMCFEMFSSQNAESLTVFGEDRDAVLNLGVRQLWDFLPATAIGSYFGLTETDVRRRAQSWVPEEDTRIPVAKTGDGALSSAAISIILKEPKTILRGWYERIVANQFTMMGAVPDPEFPARFYVVLCKANDRKPVPSDEQLSAWEAWTP